jgi:tRNA modification GTPase
MSITAPQDTIAAIATPLGPGGIGIIRLSGPEAVAISSALIRGAFPQPRIATYRDFLDTDGNALDQGIILYFPKPNSFTGEDVVELQGHGSPAVLNALLRNLFIKGARYARPGEFSERAFLNQRLDLAQAEAIADLIHADSEAAARAATRSLQGAFSKQVQSINEHLINLRAQVEAAIDFSEEGVELSIEQVGHSIQDLINALQKLRKEAQQGQRLQEGLQLVIAGPPNAGKSSLLNALSGQETAIISATPGTTRDILTATINLDGLPVHILDTAGLHATDNLIEKEGIRRALAVIEKADQILWVVDSTLSNDQTTPHQTLALFNSNTLQVPVAIVRNKIDLSHEPIGIIKNIEYDTIRLSAVTGAGLAELKAYLKQKVGYEGGGNIGFSARERHTTALIRAEYSLKEGLAVWRHTTALEILAVHLTEAHQTLGEITGLFTTEELLGRIFSNFCIGK